MKPTPITSLDKIPIAIVPSAKQAAPFRPRGSFKLPIVLDVTATSVLVWSKEHALNLSYRWFEDSGGCIDREGRRTALPVDRLGPGERIEVDLAGSTPDEPGVYQLTVSLVLEGVEWACDVGPSGWMQITVPVTLGPAWPSELKASVGGRTLRGALVATELARTLAARGGLDNAADRQAAVGPRPPTQRSRTIVPLQSRASHSKWKIRLRRALGIDDLHDQLDALLAMASRQEGHAVDLEAEIHALKDELRREPEASTVHPPSFEQQMNDASGRLKNLTQRQKATSSERSTGVPHSTKPSARAAANTKAPR